MLVSFFLLGIFCLCLCVCFTFLYSVKSLLITSSHKLLALSHNLFQFIYDACSNISQILYNICHSQRSCSIFHQTELSFPMTVKQVSKKMGRKLRWHQIHIVGTVILPLLSHSFHKRSYKATLHRGVGYFIRFLVSINILLAPNKQKFRIHLT